MKRNNVSNISDNNTMEPFVNRMTVLLFNKWMQSITYSHIIRDLYPVERLNEFEFMNLGFFIHCSNSQHKYVNPSDFSIKISEIIRPRSRSLTIEAPI